MLAQLFSLLRAPGNVQMTQRSVELKTNRRFYNVPLICHYIARILRISDQTFTVAYNS